MRLALPALSLLLAVTVTAPAAHAETKMIDLDQVPSKRIHNSADIRPLAVTSAGTPSVIVFDVAKGIVVPPHATKTGLRLLTVLSGDMSWGDGEEIDTSRETIYPAGSHLLVKSGEMHWLAARGDEDVRIQLVLLHDQKLTPAVAKQADK